MFYDTLSYWLLLILLLLLLLLLLLFWLIHSETILENTVEIEP